MILQNDEFYIAAKFRVIALKLNKVFGIWISHHFY